MNVFTIGPKNPVVGRRVHVRWLRKWGGHDPDFEAEGELVEAFTPNGRAMLGTLRLDSGRTLACPWSRRYLQVDLV